MPEGDAGDTGDTTTTTTDDKTTTDDQTGDQPDWEKKHAEAVAQSRKWEDRAKANATASADLKKLRESTMGETEKAVATARDEAKAEARKEFGSKLVTAEIRAAAAGRTVNIDALLDGVDASRFVDDDGEPDTKAIVKWLDELAPKGDGSGTSSGFPDLGQGNRGGSNAKTGSEQVDAFLKGKR